MENIKSHIIFLIGLIMLLMTSCHQPVVFRHAQPTGVEPLPSFDPAYRGKFLCESDSALIEIQARQIVKTKSTLVKMALEEIQYSDDIQLINNEIYIKEIDAMFPAKIADDSVSAEIPIRDILFEISDDVILKSFRGHQLLNFKIGPGTWDVWVLSMDENMDLRLSKAEIPDQLEDLERITPVDVINKEYGIQLRLSPTPMELHEILQQKLVFQECDVFYRVAQVIEM